MHAVPCPGFQQRGLDFGWVNSVGDAALAKCGGCTSCSTDEAPAQAAPVSPDVGNSTGSVTPVEVRADHNSTATPAASERAKVTKRIERCAFRRIRVRRCQHSQASTRRAMGSKRPDQGSDTALSNERHHHVDPVSGMHFGEDLASDPGLTGCVRE